MDRRKNYDDDIDREDENKNTDPGDGKNEDLGEKLHEKEITTERTERNRDRG